MNKVIINIKIIDNYKIAIITCLIDLLLMKIYFLFNIIISLYK